MVPGPRDYAGLGPLRPDGACMAPYICIWSLRRRIKINYFLFHWWCWCSVVVPTAGTHHPLVDPVLTDWSLERWMHHGRAFDGCHTVSRRRLSVLLWLFEWLFFKEFHIDVQQVNVITQLLGRPSPDYIESLQSDSVCLIIWYVLDFREHFSSNVD